MREGPGAGRAARPGASGSSGASAGRGDALRQALRAVAALAPELDDVGLAEVLWLAAVRDGRAADVASVTPETITASEGSTAVATSASTTASQTPVTPPPSDPVTPAAEPVRSRPRQASSSEFYENIASTSQGTAIAGKAVAVPRGSVLPRSLELGRALRPFKRAWADGPRRVLDVEATARDYARSGELLPVLRARQERWLDLALVVDRSPSMAVWHEVAAEFAGLLRRLGAFKRVRVWDLAMDGEGRPVLRPADGSAGAAPGTGARNQILVLSDCSADGWYQDPMWQLLHEWGAAVPTALINPLPARLWPMTALDLPAVRVASPGPPAARNSRLEYHRPWHLRAGADAEMALTPLPVAMLTPYGLESWARVLMSAGTVGGADLAGCDAVLIPARGRFPEVDGAVDAVDPEGGSVVSGEKLVDDFFANASKPAARLAVMCAPYTRLTMPLLHLVHQTMVPEATVAEVAEVVVSGLFDTSGSSGVGAAGRAGSASAAEAPVLRPRPGVQEALEELLGADDAWQMYDVLSRYIAGHAGSLAELAAAVRDPAGAVGLPAELRPFAAATADTLRMLGALPPAEVVEALEAVEGGPGPAAVVEDGEKQDEDGEGGADGEEKATGLAKVVAFQAHVRGIGTTTAAANVALIIAAHGKRVLFVDWSAHPGQAERLLRPLLGEAGTRAVRDYEVFPVNWAFADGGSLDFLCGTRPDPRSTAYMEFCFEALGEYDYILIDGLTEEFELRWNSLGAPEAVVACFPLSNRSIARSSAVHIERGLRVVPVPMGVRRHSEQDLAHAHSAFGGLSEELDGNWQIGVIHQEQFAERDVPTALVGGSGLGDLYEVTWLITSGEVSDMLPIDPDQRAAISELYATSRSGRPMHVVYTSADRIWAEWVADLLTARGADVTLHPVYLRDLAVAAEGTDWVVIESERFHQSEHGPSFVHDLVTARQTIWKLTVSDTDDLLFELPGVNLASLHEHAAEEAVLQLWGGGRPTRVDREHMTRHPERLPDIRSSPSPSAFFIGRDELMDQLRTALKYDRPPIKALVGMGGIGKTQIALEYASRFGSDYDIVWWIDGQSRESLMMGLATLAERLSPPDQSSYPEDDRRESLDALLQTSRRLIVVDDLRDPTLLTLLPLGGHLIVTSRFTGPSMLIQRFDVDVLPRADSIRLLQRGRPDMTDSTARQVAEELGDLPLALAIVGSQPTPVDAYPGEVHSDPVAFLSRHSANDYGRPFSDICIADYKRLLTESPAAARLLEIVAFLALEIRLPLLEAELAFQELSVVRPLIDQLERQSLLRRKNDTIVIHRLVQVFIKAWMSERERRQTQDLVHRLLNSFRPDPPDVEDPSNWPDYELVWPHLGPSDAANSMYDGARWLCLDRVAYLHFRGDYRTARLLAEELIAQWGADFDHGLRLARGALAMVLRAEGRYREAIGLDEAQSDTNDAEDVGPSLSRAADLRGLGEMAFARRILEVTVRAAMNNDGADNARTLAAMHDLALACRLAGDYQRAYELATEVLVIRQGVDGRLHPRTLTSQASLARSQRLMGWFSRSSAEAEQACVELSDVVGAHHPATIRAATSWSVSLRLTGRLMEALSTADRAFHAGLEIGQKNPDMLAFRVNLSAALSATAGHTRAIESAAEALEHSHGIFGARHPFTAACESNLAVYLRRAGRSGAIDHAQEAVGALEGALGSDHPSTLAAMVNLANCLAEQGQASESPGLETRARDGLTRVLGQNHPHTLAVISNIGCTRRALEGDSKALRGSTAVPTLIQTLGRDNPFTILAEQGARIDLELEIEPG